MWCFCKALLLALLLLAGLLAGALAEWQTGNVERQIAMNLINK